MEWDGWWWMIWWWCGACGFRLTFSQFDNNLFSPIWRRTTMFVCLAFGKIIKTTIIEIVQQTLHQPHSVRYIDFRIGRKTDSILFIFFLRLHFLLLLEWHGNGMDGSSKTIGLRLIIARNMVIRLGNGCIDIDGAAAATWERAETFWYAE